MRKRMSSLLLGLMLACSSGVVYSSEPTKSHDEYLQAAFDMSEGEGAVMLSQQEMQDTEGAWIPHAIGGGLGFVSGNYAYLTNAAFDRNVTFSWSDYGRTVAMSTITGSITPVRTVQTASLALGTSWLSAWNLRW